MDSRNLQMQYTNREDGNTSSQYLQHQKQGNNNKPADEEWQTQKRKAYRPVQHSMDRPKSAKETLQQQQTHHTGMTTNFAFPSSNNFIDNTQIDHSLDHRTPATPQHHIQNKKQVLDRSQINSTSQGQVQKIQDNNDNISGRQDLITPTSETKKKDHHPSPTGENSQQKEKKRIN
ncbi:hypothetical protein RDI58_007157 [Solanum bulbocastanum]|uniref:Uncharacterized protein n=1 Tax=Solanum bulbocastanum TaxID=147425 RepID=A0AAN8YHG1_SOLBU